MQPLGTGSTRHPHPKSGSETTVPSTSSQVPIIRARHAAPVGQLVPAALPSEAPSPVVVNSPVTIAGGKEVRPITKMSESDWTVAGRPPGGRKKEAGTATSSPPGISRHSFAAQLAASDGHASVPTQERRKLELGSS